MGAILLLDILKEFDLEEVVVIYLFVVFTLINTFFFFDILIALSKVINRLRNDLYIFYANNQERMFNLGIIDPNALAKVKY